jgi:hypothetical protein
MHNNEVAGVIVNEEPRASDQPEVNEAPVRIQESCSCGSAYSIELPAEFRTDALKGVNTWRKYHACVWTRQREPNPNPNAEEAQSETVMPSEVLDIATEQAHP